MKATFASSSSASYSDDDDLVKTSLLRRILAIVPTLDIMGYMTDHRLNFREHWVESCRLQPERLKTTMSAQAELELILAILYVSITSGIFFSALTSDNSYSENFTAGEVTLSSVCVFFGILSIISGIGFVMTSYMSITLLQTVSKENVYAFCKAHVRLLHLPTALLAFNFYVSLIYICLLLIKVTGGGWRSHLLTWGILSCFLVPIYPLYVLAFNVSIKSGSFSSNRIISEEKVINLSREEIDIILFNRARRNNELSSDPAKFYMQMKNARNESENIAMESSMQDGDNFIGRKGLLNNHNKTLSAASALIH